MSVKKMDGVTKCSRCGASAHDFVGNRGKRNMALQCCFCMCIDIIPGNVDDDADDTAPPQAGDGSAPAAHGDPGKFVLKYGRWKGWTIESVAKLGPRGVEYLKLVAGDSKALSPIISEFFARPAVGALQSEAAFHIEPHRPPSRQEASITGSQ